MPSRRWQILAALIALLLAGTTQAKADDCDWVFVLRLDTDVLQKCVKGLQSSVRLLEMQVSTADVEKRNLEAEVCFLARELGNERPANPQYAESARRVCADLDARAARMRKRPSAIPAPKPSPRP